MLSQLFPGCRFSLVCGLLSLFGQSIPSRSFLAKSVHESSGCFFSFFSFFSNLKIICKYFHYIILSGVCWESSSKLEVILPLNFEGTFSPVFYLPVLFWESLQDSEPSCRNVTCFLSLALEGLAFTPSVLESPRRWDIYSSCGAPLGPSPCGSSCPEVLGSFLTCFFDNFFPPLYLPILGSLL